MAAPAPGRNDPCPSGSGKKYKMCHGATPQPSPPDPGDAAANGAGEELEVTIEKEVRFVGQGTAVKRLDNGGLKLSFIVNDGGQVVQYTFQVGPESKKAILSEASGGLVTP
jgi:hypothetical protein